MVIILMSVLLLHCCALNGHEKSRERLRRTRALQVGDVEHKQLERRRLLTDARRGKRTAPVRACSRTSSTSLVASNASANAAFANTASANAASNAASMCPTPSAAELTPVKGSMMTGGFGGGFGFASGGGASCSSRPSALSDGDRLKAYSNALKTTSAATPPPPPPQYVPLQPPPGSTPQYMQMQQAPPLPPVGSTPAQQQSNLLAQQSNLLAQQSNLLANGTPAQQSQPRSNLLASVFEGSPSGSSSGSNLHSGRLPPLPPR